MQKHRVILILISLALIVTLYFLPRIVMDNEKDENIGAPTAESESELSDAEGTIRPEDFNSKDISKSDIDKINRFRNDLQSETSDQLIIADSLSEIFISYNQYDSAAKYLAIIASINPGIETYENAGNAYYEALGFAMDKSSSEFLSEKARFYFNKVMEQDPSRLDIKNKLAMTYISTDNPMQGISLFREILLEDQENEEAIFNLGILAIQSRQYERASERFKKLVSLYPQNLRGQFYLGLCYFELGDRSNAKRQFELVKSMEDDPAVLATVEGYLQELN